MSEQENPQQVELDENSNVDDDEATRQLREGEARALGALPAESEDDDPWDREQAHVNPFQE